MSLNATLSESYHELIAPMTKNGGAGCSMCELLANTAHTGDATVVAVVPWRCSVHGLIRSIADWAERGGHDPRKEFVWIDAFSINHHGRIIEPSYVLVSFPRGLASIGRVVVLLDTPAESTEPAQRRRSSKWLAVPPQVSSSFKPTILNSPWSLYSLYYSIDAGAELDTALAPVLFEELIDEITEEGMTPALTTLTMLNIRGTKIHNEHGEIRTILGCISSGPGFAAVHSSVCRFLRGWLIEVGEIALERLLDREQVWDASDAERGAQLSNEMCGLLLAEHGCTDWVRDIAVTAYRLNIKSSVNKQGAGVALALANLGRCRWEEAEKSEEYLWQSLAMSKTLVTPDSVRFGRNTVPSPHESTRVLFNHPGVALANVYLLLSEFYEFSCVDYPEALKHAREALKLHKTIYGNWSEVTASSYVKVGILAGRNGDNISELKELRRARSIQEQVLGEGHPTTRFTVGIIDASMARRAWTKKEYAKSARLLERGRAATAHLERLSACSTLRNSVNPGGAMSRWQRGTKAISLANRFVSGAKASKMKTLMSILGDQLVDGPKGDTSSTIDVLCTTKYVGIYFGASWDESSQEFLPTLKEFNSDCLGAGFSFRVVYCPTETTEEDYNAAIAAAPFAAAVPFSAKSVRRRLLSRFRVQSVPRLLVLNKHSETIYADARELVLSCENVRSFPWSGCSNVISLLGDSFVGGNGQVYQAEVVRGKHVALYFAAEWSEPCRALEALLGRVYTKYRNDRARLIEIVYVSSDTEAEEYAAALCRMPWLALPFLDDHTRVKLTALFAVEALPRLVIIGPRGDIINENARSALLADVSLTQYPWHPLSVTPLHVADDVNDIPTLIVFVDLLPEAGAQLALEQLKKYAENIEVAAAAELMPPLKLSFASQGDVVAPWVQRMCNFPKGIAQPVMLIIDVHAMLCFLPVERGAPTFETISAFVDAYHRGDLVGHPMEPAE